MANSRATPATQVELIPAAAEREPMLANLFELYAHDFSEFVDLRLGQDGRFGYEHLRSYWEEPGRHPFLITVNGHPAGFAFVRQGSEISGGVDVWDMAEFFIVRGVRRRGVGMRVAQEIWRRFPGRWEVRVVERNEKARAFWQRTIKEFLGEAVEPLRFVKGGQSWHVFSFESERAA